MVTLYHSLVQFLIMTPWANQLTSTSEVLLNDYPVIIDIPLQWGEMDAFQHVNNTVYFRWFESGRIAYFERLEMMRRKGNQEIGPILAHTDCRFRIPLTFPDTVSIGTKVKAVGDDRFLMECIVVSHRHRKIAAQGSGLVVMYDYVNDCKATVPLRLRQAMERLEGQSLPVYQPQRTAVGRR